MFIPLRGLGKLGVVPDSQGQAMPVGAWKDALNVRFSGLSMEKMLEPSLEVDLTIDPDAEPVHVTPEIKEPKWVQGWSDGLTSFFAMAAAAADGNDYLYFLRRSSADDPGFWQYAGGPYDSAGNWQSFGWGDTCVFNHGLSPPQILNPSTALFENLPKWGFISNAEDILNLRDPSRDTYALCQWIVPYKGFLVAGGVTENGKYGPNTVWWSNATSLVGYSTGPYNTGGPPDWDYESPASLSGKAEVGAGDGRLEWAGMLNESLICYNTGSATALTLVGGTNVMDFRRLFNKGCAGINLTAEFNNLHFVLSRDQIYVHDGSSVNLIAKERVEEEFFRRAGKGGRFGGEEIDFSAMQVVKNPDRKEIYLLFGSNYIPVRFGNPTGKHLTDLHTGTDILQDGELRPMDGWVLAKDGYIYVSDTNTAWSAHYSDDSGLNFQPVPVDPVSPTGSNASGLVYDAENKAIYYTTDGANGGYTAGHKIELEPASHEGNVFTTMWATPSDFTMQSGWGIQFMSDGSLWFSGRMSGAVPLVIRRVKEPFTATHYTEMETFEWHGEGNSRTEGQQITQINDTDVILLHRWGNLHPYEGTGYYKTKLNDPGNITWIGSENLESNDPRDLGNGFKSHGLAGGVGSNKALGFSMSLTPFAGNALVFWVLRSSSTALTEVMEIEFEEDVHYGSMHYGGPDRGWVVIAGSATDPSRLLVKQSGDGMSWAETLVFTVDHGQGHTFDSYNNWGQITYGWDDSWFFAYRGEDQLYHLLELELDQIGSRRREALVYNFEDDNYTWMDASIDKDDDAGVIDPDDKYACDSLLGECTDALKYPGMVMVTNLDGTQHEGGDNFNEIDGYRDVDLWNGYGFTATDDMNTCSEAEWYNNYNNNRALHFAEPDGYAGHEQHTYGHVMSTNAGDGTAMMMFSVQDQDGVPDVIYVKLLDGKDILTQWIDEGQITIENAYPQDGKSHLCILQIDREQGTMHLYIDGVLTVARTGLSISPQNGIEVWWGSGTSGGVNPNWHCPVAFCYRGLLSSVQRQDLYRSFERNFEDYSPTDGSDRGRLIDVACMTYSFNAGFAVRWSDLEAAGTTWAELETIGTKWSDFYGHGTEENMYWLGKDGLYRADQTVKTDGIKSYYVHRDDLDLDDVVDQWTSYNYKYSNQMFFHIEHPRKQAESVPNSFNLTMGAKNNLMDDPSWRDPVVVHLNKTANNGKHKADYRVTGRYLAMHISFDETGEFKMSGCEMQAEEAHGR